MAKIRTIKPAMTTDEKLSEVSIQARYLFAMSLMFVDDAGRMEYSPKRLKMQVFPSDEIDASLLVDELIGAGVFLLYSDGTRELICIPNFLKHQRIHKPTPSTLPAPQCSTRNTGNKAGEQGIIREEVVNPVVTGKKCEELEVELNFRNGMEGEGSKAPPGFSSQSLSRPLAEKVHLPVTMHNLLAVGAAIDAVARQRESPPNEAFDWLLARSLEDQGAGVKIDKFYFEDAKYAGSGKQPSKAIERASNNARSILAGLGVEQNASTGGSDRGTGDSARRGQVMVGDVQGNETRDVRTRVPQLPENGQILPKAR